MMLQIPEDISSTDLLGFLYPNKFDSDEDKNASNLLHKICRARLTDFHSSDLIDDLKITEGERDVIVANQWDKSANCEVKARCLDVLRRFEKDKCQKTENASDCYLDVHFKGHRVEYLVRAITVRNIKVLNNDAFLHRVKCHIDERIHPHWLNNLIVVLLKSYTIEKLFDLIPSIVKWRNAATLEKDFPKERGYIEVLFKLKSISKTEFHKQVALSFEKEADEIANNRQQNTYYPNLPDIYQKAYDEIFKIRDVEPNIFNRIKEKLLNERRIFIDMLSKCGVKYRMDVPEDFKEQIKEYIKKISIKQLDETLALLLSIPFPTADDIKTYLKICIESSPMASLMGKCLLNNKGNIVGKADSNVSLQTEAHIHLRQLRFYSLWTYLDLIKRSEIDSDIESLFAILQENKPNFIEEDNLRLWANGISAGFNQDFITAAHILMPQLEHALHNIAEIKRGAITSLEAKRQEEPTLGKILILLKGIIEQETLFEIESFLQSGIDVNFRNNLLHGLITPFEIEKNGIYLWWLCLKIFFCQDIYVESKPSS